MADFARMRMEDGTEILFEERSDGLASLRTGAPDVENVAPEIDQLEKIAQAAGQLSASLRQRLSPDELKVEVGVGISGEVGWFFARSAVEGHLKVTMTWRNYESNRPAGGTVEEIGE
jgi:hypothetical protein